MKSSKHPDKKRSIELLLDSTGANASFREQLNTEMHALTTIGNTFRIRHSEVSQTALESSAEVDYLFSRLFAILWLLLVDGAPAATR